TVDGANLPQIAPDEIPPVDPSLIVSEIEDTSFLLAWTKYEDVQNPDKEIEYTVYLYKQNGSAPRSAEEMMRGNPDYTVNTTDTSHRFENMGSRTRYNFTIIAQNSVGNTAEVGTSDVVTGNRAPGAFDIITPEEGAQDVGTTAELEWEASVDPDGDAVRYYVYLDTVKDTNRMVGPIEGISETQHIHPLNRLQLKKEKSKIKRGEENDEKTIQRRIQS
ncbi:MAG: fibronectin type III domain-containing protein, partial [Clostridia bacterium]|nr:fibronectin type III domain-containing protein [Clostridia bacterium]